MKASELRKYRTWRAFYSMVKAGMSAHPNDRVGVVSRIAEQRFPHPHSNTPERIANTALRLISWMLSEKKENEE